MKNRNELTEFDVLRVKLEALVADRNELHKMATSLQRRFGYDEWFDMHDVYQWAFDEGYIPQPPTVNLQSSEWLAFREQFQVLWRPIRDAAEDAMRGKKAYKVVFEGNAKNVKYKLLELKAAHAYLSQQLNPRVEKRAQALYKEISALETTLNSSVNLARLTPTDRLELEYRQRQNQRNLARLMTTINDALIELEENSAFARALAKLKDES